MRRPPGSTCSATPLDAVAAHPGITARQQGLAGLCRTCRSCPVVTSCGGGLYTHRYRTGSGFANPSVYCPDLLKLISHVREATRPQRTAARPPGPAGVARAAGPAGRQPGRGQRARGTGRGGDSGAAGSGAGEPRFHPCRACGRIPVACRRAWRDHGDQAARTAQASLRRALLAAFYRAASAARPPGPARRACAQRGMCCPGSTRKTRESSARCSPIPTSASGRSVAWSS